MRIPLLWALMAATAAGDDLAGLAEPRPKRAPRSPADPDEVARLARDGTESEIQRYRHDHHLSSADDGALLQRLDDLDFAYHAARLERLERIAQQQEARDALLRAERQAQRAAEPVTPLAVRCPRCRARPGKRCRGANALMDTPHPERVRAAQRKAAR